MENNISKQDEIISAIKNVYDPEIPVDIYELGLIYDVEVGEEGKVHIVMTLTTPNCPAAEDIPMQVEQEVKNVEGVTEVKVQITFDPPWNKEMMSEEARLELGFL
ncbi:MAG: SUF system Fe-S cluster assembly protein [Candidatus Competibacteraceae bacterium]|nr:SUF system Fe-S cluster assembly protein [Candidatus Competibacteraceae bacterium]